MRTPVREQQVSLQSSEWTVTAEGQQLTQALNKPLTPPPRQCLPSSAWSRQTLLSLPVSDVRHLFVTKQTHLCVQLAPAEVSDPETVVIREELVYVRVSFAREALTDGRNPHLCTRAAGGDCRDEDTVDELDTCRCVCCHSFVEEDVRADCRAGKRRGLIKPASGGGAGPCVPSERGVVSC